MATIDDIEIPSLLFAEGAAPSTPATGFGRLYVKTDGIYFMGDDGVEIGPLGAGGGASSLQSARHVRSAGNYTTTSATYADVDGTNFSFTFTTGAHRVLLGFVGVGALSNAAGLASFDVTVDGTRQGGTGNGLVPVQQHATANENINFSFTYLTDVLTAASHTFKLQFASLIGGHTLTVYGTDPKCEFYAVEMLA